jgi:hypothetical protein
VRGFVPWPQLDLFGGAPAAPAPAPAREPVAPPRRRVAPPAAALPGAERWDFTRPWLGSPHLPRARRELDLVRDQFPELESVVVRVGLTKRRGVLGLASLGETPMIWVRPRRLRRFAIAHELTHLLHARGLVPGGEKTCDLYALARSAVYVDVAPFYLEIPAVFHEGGPERRVPPGAARALHALAREALEGRTARSAIRRFERRAREHSGVFDPLGE